MLRRFLCVRPASALALPATFRFTSSGVKSHDPTWEDDRWLEAELANKELTAEERYALIKQREVLKGMLKKVANDTETKMAAQHIAEKTKPEKVDESPEALKAKIASLEKVVAHLINEKHK
eukprot:PhM_4_TR12383/c0_g1_i1/m.61645